jgi:hypothetical protein
MLLPQVGEQFGSSACVVEGGQHPSFGSMPVIKTCVQYS